MIEVYTKNQTVLTGSALPLNAIAIEKGCDCKLSGTSAINLNRRGVYKVAVSADAIATAGGNIQLRLYKSSIPQEQSVATETASDTTSVHSLEFVTLVQVKEDDSCCCCKSATPITIMNEGVEITLRNLDVVVTRITKC